MTPWPGLPPYPATPDPGHELRVARENRTTALWTVTIVLLALLGVGMLVAVPVLALTTGAFLDHDDSYCRTADPTTGPAAPQRC